MKRVKVAKVAKLQQLALLKKVYDLVRLVSLMNSKNDSAYKGCNSVDAAVKTYTRVDEILRLVADFIW